VLVLAGEHRVGQIVAYFGRLHQVVLVALSALTGV
jgi:hypothetical protein